ncbi:MAG: hypothetical protein HQL15_07595 [Candidatus Omnitrophica bacterium]|nr:hypothetical protein [Candidatus Omnitrophota bacterium]
MKASVFNQESIVRISVGFLSLILLIQPKLSYADWGDHRGAEHRESGHREVARNYRYHDHPSFGIRLSILPRGYFSVWQGGSRYYYYEGLYYTRLGHEYVLVRPPLGAIVREIPQDFHTVMINGMTYYTDDGIYYVYTRRGYQVVRKPLTVIERAPVYVSSPRVPVATTIDSQDLYNVNIPNHQGGYSSVMIRRSGRGFVGPQGEFYEEFPKVEHLRVMYQK